MGKPFHSVYICNCNTAIISNVVGITTLTVIDNCNKLHNIIIQTIITDFNSQTVYNQFLQAKYKDGEVNSEKRMCERLGFTGTRFK